MIQTNYRPTTSHAGLMFGIRTSGVVFGAGSSFGERLKARNEELADPHDMSRGSP